MPPCIIYKQINFILSNLINNKITIIIHLSYSLIYLLEYYFIIIYYIHLKLPVFLYYLIFIYSYAQSFDITNIYLLTFTLYLKNRFFFL
jgi:hypothetical protein